MDASQLDYLIPVIIAIIAGVPGVYAVVQQAKRGKVSDETSLSAATLALLKPYQDEVKRLRMELEPLKQRIMELEIKLDEVIEGAHRLAMQIRKNGEEPVWEPPTHEVKKK